MKKHVIVIAEAGVNHNGDISKAFELIKVAADSGADYIKFQIFKAELSLSKSAEKASYQANNTGSSESQYDMVKKLELSYEDFLKIKEECDRQKIGFLSTAFDFPSLEFLEKFRPEFYKIPSGEITNLPYLKRVATYRRKVILSTGMADMNEIQTALSILIQNGLRKEDITVLHCNTEYPTPMEDVNLHAMNTIGKELEVEVGYSDHTLGIEVPIAAVALGARVIEKHFTLDNNLPGPDHKASLEPGDLKAMVTAIRNVEKAISGTGEKSPTPSEIKNIPVVRRSIVASKKIVAGDIFTEDNLAVKRPGTGTSPLEWEKILGTRATKDYNVDEQI